MTVDINVSYQSSLPNEFKTFEAGAGLVKTTVDNSITYYDFNIDGYIYVYTPLKGDETSYRRSYTKADDNIAYLIDEFGCFPPSLLESALRLEEDSSYSTQYNEDSVVFESDTAKYTITLDANRKYVRHYLKEEGGDTFKMAFSKVGTTEVTLPKAKETILTVEEFFKAENKTFDLLGDNGTFTYVKEVEDEDDPSDYVKVTYVYKFDKNSSYRNLDTKIESEDGDVEASFVIDSEEGKVYLADGTEDEEDVYEDVSDMINDFKKMAAGDEDVYKNLEYVSTNSGGISSYNYHDLDDSYGSGSVKVGVHNDEFYIQEFYFRTLDSYKYLTIGYTLTDIGTTVTGFDGE